MRAGACDSCPVRVLSCALVSAIEVLVRPLQAFVEALPVDDAAASSLAAPFDVETLAATSRRAARCEEASIDLGEGPAWEAFHSQRPVGMRLDEERDRPVWPFFAAAPAIEDVGSVLAFPLTFGLVRIGAVSLYSSRTLTFDGEQFAVARTLATLLACAVIVRALDEAQTGAAVGDPALSRREVHQATGMVIAQTGCTPAAALLRIRGQAFSTSTSVRNVATEVLARRLTFSDDPDIRK